MKKFTSSLVVAVSLTGLALAITGCEREVARTSETQIKDDGTVKTREKTVTEGADGDITVTEERSTTKPN